MKVIKTCNKCCNAQAKEGSKYCQKCDSKVKNKTQPANKMTGDVNNILHKIGFHLS